MKRNGKSNLSNEYIALFEIDEEAGCIGVIFPDLPGCFSIGDDFEDAFNMAHEAIACHLEDEDSPPPPRTLEQIKAEWEDWEEWDTTYKFYITKIAYYPLKPTTRKFNISLDERLVRRIDRITNNRSAFIAEAVEKMLNQTP